MMGTTKVYKVFYSIPAKFNMVGKEKGEEESQTNLSEAKVDAEQEIEEKGPENIED